MDFNAFDGVPPVPAHEMIACAYTNEQGELQILRITNVDGWYFERVVFPAQTLGFAATPEAIAAIYTCNNAGCLLDDHIRCIDLQIYEETLPQDAQQRELTAI
jgi:Domain of unknown function (DUF1830)